MMSQGGPLMSQGRAEGEQMMSQGRARDGPRTGQGRVKGKRPSRSYYQNLAQRDAERETESMTRRPVAARA